MSLFKKLFNRNKATQKEQEITQVQNEQYLANMEKKIITILKIAESEIYYTDSKIANFNLLSDKEVEYLYDNINNTKQNVEIFKEFAVKFNFENQIKKADEILDRIENLKDEFNRKLTGIIY